MILNEHVGRSECPVYPSDIDTHRSPKTQRERRERRERDRPMGWPSKTKTRCPEMGPWETTVRLSIDHQYLMISHSYPRLSSFINYILVGGLEHGSYFPQLGWWSNLTNSIIFQRGRYATKQIFLEHSTEPGEILRTLWYDYDSCIVDHDVSILRACQ